MTDKFIETALYRFKQTIHAYVNCDWGDRDLARKFYDENNELAEKAAKEIEIIRELQKELRWYRTRYPGPNDPELENI